MWPVADHGLARVELDADPSAVGLARAWLTSRLSDWSSDGQATVQLLVSELVTNAILHSTDLIEVSAERDGPWVTVEVSDRSPAKPIVKTYGQEAATGRGLRLVEALAASWGVRGDETRKSVWFKVVDDPALREQESSKDSEEPTSVGGSWPEHRGAPAPAPPGARGGPEVTVRLRQLPVATYLAVEEHHDALVRELTLLPAPDDTSPDSSMSPRLLWLAAQLSAQFGAGNQQRREQVESARLAGERTVDVVMLFPAGSQDQVVAVADQLDEVDQFCASGALLTPPSTPSVKRFRRWYTDEIVRQMSGQASAPWPYLDDDAPAGSTPRGDR